MAKADFKTPHVNIDDAAKSGEMLDAMTDAIVGRFTTLKDDVQVWAVSAGLHAALHGDITRIQRACEQDDKGFGLGFKLNALRMFFQDKKIGIPLDWVLKNKETKEAAHFIFNREKADKLAEQYHAAPEATIALLMSKKWYSFDKEKALFEGASLPVELAKLYKKFSGYLADPEKKDHEKLDITGLDDLGALVAGRKMAAAAGQSLQ